jgi:hypothetical protein
MYNIIDYMKDMLMLSVKTDYGKNFVPQPLLTALGKGINALTLGGR